MKTWKQILIGWMLILLSACDVTSYEEDPEYVTVPGKVFEIEGDFTRQNDYMLSFSFPKNFEIYESDVVLVYILWEQATGSNGKKIDVWRLLPQSVILPEGILQYNYDYTLEDVQIFLDGSLDLKTLLASEALDQVFRIVVLPAEFAKAKSLDVFNYDLLIKSLNISALTIEKISITDNAKVLGIK